MPDLLGALGRIFYPNNLTPQDPNVDPKTGEVITLPFKQPGILSRLLLPDDSEYIAKQNSAFKLNPVNAAQQEAIDKDIFLKNAYANNPELQRYGPDEAFAKFGGSKSVNATQINPVVSGESFLSKGGPINEGFAKAEQAKAGYIASALANALGTPGAKALEENTGVRLGTEINASGLYNEPVKSYAQHLSLVNEANRQLSNVPAEQQLSNRVTQSGLAIEPFASLANLNQAKDSARMSGMLSKTAPHRELKTMNEAVGGAANSFTQPMPSIGGRLISYDAAGEPSTSLGITPDAISPQMVEYYNFLNGGGMFGGAGGLGSRVAPPTKAMSSGKEVPLPPPNINTTRTTSNPLSGTPFGPRTATPAISSINTINTNTNTSNTNSNISKLVNSPKPGIKNLTGSLNPITGHPMLDTGYLNHLMSKAGAVGSVPYKIGLVGKFFGANPDIKVIQELIDSGAFKRNGVSDDLIKEIQNTINRSR